MKLHKLFLLITLFAGGCVNAFAQTAGTMIQGTVEDDIEPLMMANVVEIDEQQRIVAHAVTDINGNFSFKIVNPKHRLRISYIGYVTQTIPIKGTTYKIRMRSSTQLTDVVIQAKKVVQSSGLAIPERELSIAHQTIDAKEFEGLGVTSVDEALQGRIAGLDIVATSGNLGSGSQMRLRGVSTINGNANP